MAPYQTKFCVRREECWGGTHVWYVVDRESHQIMSASFKTEQQALTRAKRMEVDWGKYDEAMWNKKYALSSGEV